VWAREILSFGLDVLEEHMEKKLLSRKMLDTVERSTI
jgi:hypothetical protein